MLEFIKSRRSTRKFKQQPVEQEKVSYPDTEDGLPNRKPLERTGNIVTYID